jgi:hypothetical protein
MGSGMIYDLSLCEPSRQTPAFIQVSILYHLNIIVVMTRDPVVEPFGHTTGYNIAKKAINSGNFKFSILNFKLFDKAQGMKVRMCEYVKV